MATLNTLSDKALSVINQTGNHTLRERFKLSIKELASTYIRRSIAKNGIDEILKLSFLSKLILVDDIDNVIEFEDVKLKGLNTLYRTENKIPYPVRFSNESPFTFVGSANHLIGFSYRNYRDLYKPKTSNLIGHHQVYYSYTLRNSYIYVNIYDCNTSKIDYISIESIWENPEEIVSMYSNNDGGDIEIPLPYDIQNEILYTILKTEYNIKPEELTVPINN